MRNGVRNDLRGHGRHVHHSLYDHVGEDAVNVLHDFLVGKVVAPEVVVDSQEGVIVPHHDHVILLDLSDGIIAEVAIAVFTTPPIAPFTQSEKTPFKPSVITESTASSRDLASSSCFISTRLWTSTMVLREFSGRPLGRVLSR